MHVHLLANLPVFHLKGTCLYAPYFYLTFFKNFLNHLMIIMIISTIISVVGSRYLVHYSDRQRQVGRRSGRQTTQYRKCWSAIHRHRDLDSGVIILPISIISLNYKCKLSTHKLLCDLFSVNTLLKGPYFNISETLSLFSEYHQPWYFIFGTTYCHVCAFWNFFLQRITELGAVIFIRRRKF